MLFVRPTVFGCGVALDESLHVCVHPKGSKHLRIGRLVLGVGGLMESSGHEL